MAGHMARPLRRIVSVQNALVKDWVRLRVDASFRQDSGRALLVGEAPIRETLHVSGDRAPPIHRLIFREGLEDVLSGDNWDAEVLRPAERFAVSAQVMAKVSGVESAGGVTVAAEVGVPEPAELPAGAVRRVVALDGVQDPGNVGTLIRTALGLGWDAIFLIDGCCDPFNGKALRAARGATFRLPVLRGGWGDFAAMVRTHGLDVVVADAAENGPGDQAVAVVPQADAKAGPVAIVLGSEGRGVSWPELDELDPRVVTLEMHDGMESLNVAVAGALVMGAWTPGLFRA